ncbi:MAG: sulfate adenylyltransferase subunit CysN [Sulfuricella sp.]|jgi:sulfate adenylyltransferase subunit 1
MNMIENIFKRETELLRFSTAGSVDDGKSTLIGRLLVDSKGIFEDQLEAAKHFNERKGGKGLDLALLTDGLAAEREQGITIDVAYRYFATPKRHFIIADTPGHEQYTRNMVTGASTTHLAIVLVDARKGLLPQSRRHAYIAALLGTPHIVVAVNKMDLVGYSEQVFEKIKREFAAFFEKLEIAHSEARFIPISALAGDMVVERGANMPWYQGKTLLETLEQVEVKCRREHNAFRFPVQWVSRPQTPELHDFRGYMGRIESGSVKAGDKIVVLPSGQTSTIREIVTYDGGLAEAVAPSSVTLTIEDDIDIARGDTIAHRDAAPRVVRAFDAMLCWMGEKPLAPGRKYYIKHATRTVKAEIQKIDYKVDIHTLEKAGATAGLAMNEIGRASFRLFNPLACDAYEDNRAGGGFIVIDEFSNETVAAGMICRTSV